MIRFFCPDCHAPIAFSREHASKVRECPECGRPIRVPKRSEIKEAPSAPGNLGTVDAPQRIDSRGMEGNRRSASTSEHSSGVPATGDTLPESRKKKKRKTIAEIDNEPHHYGPAIVYGAIAAAVGTLFLIPAMIHPAAAIVVEIAGGALAIVGRIWFASISPYQDHRGFRLLLGFDFSVVTSAFDRTRWPYMLQIFGTTALFMGLCAPEPDKEQQEPAHVAVREWKKVPFLIADSSRLE